MIDFASTPLAGWFEQSMLFGRLLLPLMLIVGVAHELRLTGLRPRRAAWWWLGYRVVGVGALLCPVPGERTLYEALMERGLNGALAVDLLTRQSWARLTEVASAFWKAQSDSPLTLLALDADGFGPAVVRSAVAALPLIGQSSLVGVGTLARLLAVVVYVVGPVILALSVSTGVHVLGRWVRVLAAVVVWPLLTVMVTDLSTGVLLGIERQVPSSEAALLAAGLGGFLGVASACVPLLAWGTSTLVLRAGQVAWREVAAVGSLALSRRRDQSESLASAPSPRGEAGELDLDAVDGEPEPLTPSFMRRRSIERATPSLPQAVLGTGELGASVGSRSPGATTFTPPAIPPVVPAEVAHGVQPRGAPSLLELPTPPDGVTAPAPPYPASAAAKGRGAPPSSVQSTFADEVEERTSVLEKAPRAASTRKTVPAVTPAQADRTAVQKLKE